MYNGGGCIKEVDGHIGSFLQKGGSNLLCTINIPNGGCKKKIIGCKRISDICGSIVMKNFDYQQEPEKQLISSGTKYFFIKKQTVGESVMLHKSKYL